MTSQKGSVGAFAWVSLFAALAACAQAKAEVDDDSGAAGGFANSAGSKAGSAGKAGTTSGGTAGSAGKSTGGTTSTGGGTAFGGSAGGPAFGGAAGDPFGGGGEAGSGGGVGAGGGGGMAGGIMCGGISCPMEATCCTANQECGDSFLGMGTCDPLPAGAGGAGGDAGASGASGAAGVGGDAGAAGVGASAGSGGATAGSSGAGGMSGGGGATAGTSGAGGNLPSARRAARLGSLEPATPAHAGMVAPSERNATDSSVASSASGLPRENFVNAAETASDTFCRDEIASSVVRESPSSP